MKLSNLGLSESNIQYWRLRRLVTVKDLLSYEKIEKDIKNLLKSSNYHEIMSIAVALREDDYEGILSLSPRLIQDMKASIFFLFKNKPLYQSEIQELFSEKYGVHLSETFKILFEEHLSEKTILPIAPTQEELMLAKKEKEEKEAKKLELPMDISFDFDEFYEAYNQESNLGKERYLSSIRGFKDYFGYKSNIFYSIYLHRLEGNTLEDFAKKNNISVQYVRNLMHQILISMPYTYEAFRYDPLLSAYNLSVESFYRIFPEERIKKTYAFISLLLTRRKEKLSNRKASEGFLKDKKMQTEMRLTPVEWNLSKDFILKDSGYIRLKSGVALKPIQPYVFNYLIYLAKQNPTKRYTVSQFYRMYLDIFKEIYQINPELKDKSSCRPISKEVFQIKIVHYPNLLVSRLKSDNSKDKYKDKKKKKRNENTVRYFPVKSFSSSTFFSKIMEMEHGFLKNKVISTKLFLEKDSFQSILLSSGLDQKSLRLDELELHSLLKKSTNETNQFGVSFPKKPMIFLGKVVDKKTQIDDAKEAVLKWKEEHHKEGGELIIVSKMDIANYMEENYGWEPRSTICNYL